MIGGKSPAGRVPPTRAVGRAGPGGPAGPYGVALLLILMLGACTNPMSPGSNLETVNRAGTGGTLIVGAVPGDLTGSTIFPTVNLGEIATYRFSLSGGPSGASVPAASEVVADAGGSFSGTVAFSDLVPGEWTATAEAVNGSDETLLSGSEESVTIVAGATASVEVSLGPAASGTGSYSVTISWPTDENAKAVEYSLDGEPWQRMEEGSFAESGALSEVTITGTGVPAGDYIFTARLDMGSLVWNRYRAYIDTRLQVRGNLETTATRSLTAADLSSRPPDPGSWEELEDNGDIEVAPDGGITFLPGGYDEAQGGGSIDVDPDGSITYSGSGERRLYMEMPDVTHGRLEITGADFDTGNGWGIFFHGGEDASGRYSGYTLQFDPGLGNQIVVRRWVTNTEYAPFIQVASTATELYSPMDVILEINGPQLRVEVNGNEIINETDLTGAANGPGTPTPRESGFLGIRGWSGTDLTIEDLTLYVFD